MIRAGVLLGALFLAGCATFVPPPVVRELPQAPPEDAWARVLAGYVDAQGRVDFAGLAKNRGDLDRYAAWIYAYGPANRPERYRTREQVLAYHINAYNALAMYNVIEAGIPETLSGFAKVRFFYLREVRVAGEAMTLYEYENEVIRKLGEPRLHFALNCMSAGCPRLPQEPFVAERLEQQLVRETRAFFAEGRNARQDDAARTVYLSEILDFYPEEFLAVAPSLTAYANRYREAKLPEDYEVKFTPYDWTINRQP